MQGFGVQISHADVLTDALPAAVMHVLSNARYAEAARRMSVKLTARKRTPVQEAAGAGMLLFLPTCMQQTKFGWWLTLRVASAQPQHCLHTPCPA